MERTKREATRKEWKKRTGWNVCCTSMTPSAAGNARINRLIAKNLLTLNVGDTAKSSGNVEVLSKKFAVAQLHLYCDIFNHTN